MQLFFWGKRGKGGGGGGGELGRRKVKGKTQSYLSVIYNFCQAGRGKGGLRGIQGGLRMKKGKGKDDSDNAQD